LKTQKHIKCIGKVLGIGAKLGVPKVPIGIHLNQGLITLFVFFGTLRVRLDSVFHSKN